jgi:hypothetical protein
MKRAGGGTSSWRPLFGTGAIDPENDDPLELWGQTGIDHAAQQVTIVLHDGLQNKKQYD